MSQEQDRALILDEVKKYYEKYHVTTKDFSAGDRIPYASRVYDSEEMTNLVDSCLDFWLTSGRYTDEFEKELAKYLDVRFCSLVNSGSSANLLAFMALTSPLLKERSIQRGDEVITVAAGFPTTVAPIIQFGAVPVFVDISIPSLNIDVSQLEQAYSSKTKAVMLAHTLGNPFNVVAVKEFCDKHNLWLIEDNCDALGTEVLINGEWKKTGTIGDIGTSSFYPPHHMTMGEGGAVYTNNSLLNKIIRSMRDWGRECSCPSGVDNLCGHRFDGQFGELPVGYDHKYVYSHLGYNLKATDMQAAIGCAQIKKMPEFARRRRENFAFLHNELKDLDAFFFLPKAEEGTNPSWFGFPITCKEGVDRGMVVKALEDHKVQTRMLFAGNLIKHPCFTNMPDGGRSLYRKVGELNNTDVAMERTFWIGVYPGMTEEKLKFMAKCIRDGIKSIPKQ
ncbi:MAG: lipopolysaccharide biosynthesis protein RfbH [Lachnospiraceae bacterium]|nr:lipopolysaccharide biosynthesis protein RfbH [Lachnospiraceae bacterium]